MLLMLPLPEIASRALDQACATHCPYCSLQCGMQLEPTAAESWTVAERDFPTNRGGLCQKGWTAAELLGSADRLRTPLVRDSRSAPLRAGHVGRGSGAGRRRHRAYTAAVRQRWRWSLRRRQPHQRESLPAGEVRESCAADFADRLQRPLLHVVGRGGIPKSLWPRPRSSISSGGHR